MGSTSCDRAFTLIELLIVVAIIAILAAIAVPNFLEAQTRAKVSRAQNDLRVVATAMEAYYVDNNDYPPTVQQVNATTAGNAILPLEARFEPLETPIAYITSVPLDVFGDDVAFSTFVGGPPTEYAVFDYVRFPSYDPDNFDNAIFKQQLLDNGFSSAAEWYMASQGPDLEPGLSQPGPSLGNTQTGIPYDPTNGTVSDGDMIRIGPGISVD